MIKLRLLQLILAILFLWFTLRFFLGHSRFPEHLVADKAIRAGLALLMLWVTRKYTLAIALNRRLR